MDSYMQILSEKTPSKSDISSSFLKKCVDTGNIKKGLIFGEELTDSPMAFHEQTDSRISQGDFVDSNISARLEGTYANDMHRTEVTNTVLLDVEGSTPCVDSLYDEFLDFFLSYSGEHEVFNLLSHYEELCCQQINNLINIIKKTPNETENYKMYYIQFLEERNTWRLLRTLYQDRLAQNDEESEMHYGKKLSDKIIIENLYARDAFIRQSQLIVDWLEKNAADDFKGIYFDFDYFIEHCLAWEHTLNELTILSDSNNNKTLQTEMDPDAPIRLKDCIYHDADKENTSRLLKYMFISIRSGNLMQAQQLAEKFGEPWLAAALEGWRLFHDPNYENESAIEGEELLPIEGNKYRDLWKTSCWEVLKEPNISLYEKAIYASLCGNLKMLLPVCATWQDYLWAYMRTLIDKRIEEELHSYSQQDRIMQEMPVEYWDKNLDLNQVFQELEASESEEVRNSTKRPLILIQKYLMLDDLDGLIEEMHNWLKTSKQIDSHLLRCMVHIILFFNIIGRSTKEELCIPIIEAYVQELIKSHRISLIAPYTSTLPKELQIIWYAKFLEGITDNSERQKCLTYAEDAGLDVQQITKTVVNNIREKEPEESEILTDLTIAFTEDDLQKINAIDWLIFDPNQRAEAVKQANALMRVFIAQRKIDAAKQLFNKIPEDSISVMLQLAKMKNYEELPPEEDNITKEYLCFKAYLEAMEAFNNWFHHSVHAKPKEPSLPNGSITFKQKVAYEHEMLQYEKDLERWDKVVKNLGSVASDCLYNVLLFADGGWMVDRKTVDLADENRQKQLSCLRKLCIPHVTRLQQDLLLREERFQEAVQLADIIASEQYQLYKEFSTEDIQSFLQALLEPAFNLLDNNSDPLGYSFEDQ